MIQQPHNDLREFRHYTADDYQYKHTEVNRNLGQTLEHLRQQAGDDYER